MCKHTWQETIDTYLDITYLSYLLMIQGADEVIALTSDDLFIMMIFRKLNKCATI